MCQVKKNDKKMFHRRTLDETGADNRAAVYGHIRVDHFPLFIASDSHFPESQSQNGTIIRF